ncbi:MAG: DNA mismatch repair protein MutS [Bdellovibrionaceae bacterium]|nr:DNA mismatch repair protein MutS [Pseudobdellovibrionaceae bacterium]MBX3034273.1 DNA mismatch repair protein MutS [Pseudobdellovibrionaceae bacterium]
MKQYWDIKTLHQDKILLYRMGDFFEMFFDDAVKAAPVLGIALTQRNKKGGDETPMCGMPHHSIAGSINKLLAAGFKVAICDQIEDPKQAKGLVRRAVTRVLTPGMVYDLETLDGGRAHYIVSFDEAHVSFLDTTTGEAFWIPAVDKAARRRYLEVMPLAEMVLPSDADSEGETTVMVSRHDQLADAGHELLRQGAPPSAARLLSYVESLSGGEALKILRPFSERRLQSRLNLSPTVVRHLEIFQTYKGEGPGSLLHSIDRTRTSAGHRLLRQWLSFPLTDKAEIGARWDAVEAWRKRPADLKKVREILGQMGDLERRLGKVPQPTCNGRDLLSLAHSIEAGLSSLSFAGTGIDAELATLIGRVNSTLVEEPPLSTKQGHLVRRGVSPELDEVIELSTDAHSLLARMEAEERERTGISSLKIRYNNVFGYYIEITNTHKDKAPARYQRKQTLANAERYCTEELLDLERKVLSAQTRRNEMESEIFEALRRDVLSRGSRILELAKQCSELDVVTALAWLSLERHYCRPTFSADGAIRLRASRHPVVEQSVGRDFVANDVDIGAHHCLLLTGPNMAGKSTLMRQIALTVLLAQMGSFVPALSAEVPLTDAIFTRIGASDQLSEGLSTFMVEMTETAAMLKNATVNSLVVLDEVGRGTSTFDGMCLAQAILEHLLSEVRCLTCFATHYHEITALDRLWPQILNAHMTVSEKSGEIRFLHTLEKGPATKSYGIQVADLAGLPASVTKRAKQLLRDIEGRSAQGGAQQMSLLDAPRAFEEPAVDLEKQRALDKLVSELRSLSIPNLTPLDALNRLAHLHEACHDLS